MNPIADLLVVVGPSGSGKSTLITRLREEFPNAFGYSISHTTRAARAGEENGVSYHFVSTDDFNALAANNGFLEHAVVHDTCYGTSYGSVQAVLAEGRVCLMDLDIIGAKNLRTHPTLRTVVIFLMAPNFDVLEQRLRARGTETEEKIAKRLSDGAKWVEWTNDNREFYDHILVNDDLEQCYQQFRAGILRSAFGVVEEDRS